MSKAKTVRGYIVLMGSDPAHWCDDGQNYGFYLGRHATVFPTRDIANRRVLWSEERDQEAAARHRYSKLWGYRVLLVKGP